ncbi:diaminopimelate epimerase [Chryseobacterium lacus]|uniref:Diaminopimelate epimerase n=1 Tax=Chryseobacterium lacus TaxID=2058346 RepID=A0A368MWV2_9FLAO|nr:diaminopimelate epimerase [Chryseobacterium lacus]RCU42702.1 diaminopimelate epimerase [Chryseobacterium lacus]RST27264.1 diaminopimelate epimerase [Chryseobacterium lacus]
MKSITFYKYQGTGNDFIMIDNRNLEFPKNSKLIKEMCDRRFGIGSDGLILVENDPESDFQMVYYNADGNESTMCGNGGRCIVAFASFLNIFEEECTFNAVDGLHEAKIKNETILLKMKDVDHISETENGFVLNTGSPHFVQYVEELGNFEVFNEGKAIRNSEKFRENGINVNFVEVQDENKIFVRTYERGVEDETYSCGTGVTAAALTWLRNKEADSVQIMTLGGILSVYAEQFQGTFINIWLEGPAKQVFKGEILI